MIYQTEKGLYSQCLDCGKFIKLNKFLLGSLHVCLSEEEKNKKSLNQNNK